MSEQPAMLHDEVAYFAGAANRVEPAEPKQLAASSAQSH
jgi:hypothetical protein